MHLLQFFNMLNPFILCFEQIFFLFFLVFCFLPAICLSHEEQRSLWCVKVIHCWICPVSAINCRCYIKTVRPFLQISFELCKSTLAHWLKLAMKISLLKMEISQIELMEMRRKSNKWILNHFVLPFKTQ